MKWQDLRRSSNIEDRRGLRSGGGIIKGGIGGIVLVLVALYFGVDPQLIMEGSQLLDSAEPVEHVARRPGEDPQFDFVANTLGSTEDVWQALFAAQLSQQTMANSPGGAYQPPRLAVFTDSTTTACGLGQSAMGPFYCPPDQYIYIDLGFYRDLRQRFGAPGDFAQAYVIAHEVGHHVQNLLGLSDATHRARQRLSETQGNALSVKLELQADCFAGIWAHHADQMKPLLETGDIEEALTAAAAIGDDRLQQQAGGRVVPESFTHGTSQQRVKWFRTGLESGRIVDCDTFQ